MKNSKVRKSCKVGLTFHCCAGMRRTAGQNGALGAIAGTRNRNKPSTQSVSSVSERRVTEATRLCCSQLLTPATGLGNHPPGVQVSTEVPERWILSPHRVF